MYTHPLGKSKTELEKMFQLFFGIAHIRCVCVCVCMCERERDAQRERKTALMQMCQHVLVQRGRATEEAVCRTVRKALFLKMRTVP